MKEPPPAGGGSAYEPRVTSVEYVPAEVEDDIERFYSRERRHSTLGYLSPVIYETPPRGLISVHRLGARSA